MDSDDVRLFDYTVLSSRTSSSVIMTEDIHAKKSTFIAPFLFSLLTMTAVQSIKANEITPVTQPVAICQTIDIAERLSRDEILKRFVSRLVFESKDIDPEIAQIVNRNYKELLW